MHDCVTDRVLGGKRSECAACLAADLEQAKLEGVDRELFEAVCHERDAAEEARKALWGKLVLLILGNHGGGPVSIDKNEAELTDLSQYELVEYRGESSGDYFFRVKKKA